jgi:hypothetical protein
MREPPVGNPMKPGADQGQPRPEEIKQQLVSLLKQIKQAAESNGVDWNEMVQEVSSNVSKAGATLPRPPGMPQP